MRTVYVGNLDYNVEEWRIEEFFNSAGQVEKITIPRGDDGRARGFAFVQFKELSGAKAAIDMSNTELEGRALSIREVQDNNP